MRILLILIFSVFIGACKNKKEVSQNTPLAVAKKIVKLFPKNEKPLTGLPIIRYAAPSTFDILGSVRCNKHINTIFVIKNEWYVLEEIGIGPKTTTVGFPVYEMAKSLLQCMYDVPGVYFSPLQRKAHFLKVIHKKGLEFAISYIISTHRLESQ